MIRAFDVEVRTWRSKAIVSISSLQDFVLELACVSICQKIRNLWLAVKQEQIKPSAWTRESVTKW